MSDKQWYIVFVRGTDQLLRYAVEYPIVQCTEFDSFEAYDLWYQNWLADFKRYFIGRTSIRGEILAVEGADILSAYAYKGRK